MGLAQSQFQTIQSVAKRSRSILVLWGALGLGFALTPAAKAGFIGDYALSQFTLANTNADGFAVSQNGGSSILLTGGNNGSDQPGTTDLITAAAGAGTVQFQYSYSALDFPGFDFAGYLLGGAFTQLADTDGQSGTTMFTVSPGQPFGFRVGTLDNTGEPGMLTISNFSAPSGTGAVPEPGTGTTMLLAAAAAIAVQRRLSGTRGPERNV